MPIRITCAECGRQLRVPDRRAGSKARCPQCKAVFTVPGSPTPPTSKPESWTVNTVAGEHFGPISREELDCWVAEGRITADCQITQQGDNRAVSAGQLYPQLVSANPFTEQESFGPQIVTDNPYSSPTSSSGKTGRSQRPHRGGMILALGILGLVICAFCSIPAWIMGKSDLDDMKRGRMDKSGYGLTQAGMVMGIIGTVLIGLGLLFVVAVMLGVMTFG